MIRNLPELVGDRSQSALAAVSYLEAYYKSNDDTGLELLSLMHKNLNHTDIMKGLCFTAIMFITYLDESEDLTAYVTRLGTVLKAQGDSTIEERTVLNLLASSQEEDLTEFQLTLHTIEDTENFLMVFAGFNHALLNKSPFPDKTQILADLKQTLLELEITKLHGNK